MSMWIEKCDKAKYVESGDITGLRLHFSPDIPPEDKKWCKDYCKWLSRRYVFPIQCKIFFENEIKFKSSRPGRYCSAVFFSNEEYKTWHYPSIYVAAKFDTALDREWGLINIGHELTHYFQWYFDNTFDNEVFSHRKLEYWATVWGKYLASEYLYDIGYFTEEDTENNQE